MLLSPCLQWVLYAIIPSVYKIYRPPFGRDDILHITLLLRKRAICGNIVSRAGHNIQIHSGIIAHIFTRGSSTKLTLDLARLSLISLREGRYTMRNSARVSSNTIQGLNIAG